MVVATAAVIVVIVLLLRGSPGTGIDETIEVVEVPVAPPEAPPVASVESVGGPFRLDLVNLEIAPPPPGMTEIPKAMIQGRITTGDPRLIAGSGIEILWVGKKPPEGECNLLMEHRLDDIGYVGYPCGPRNEFAIHGINPGPEPGRIDFLMLKTTILRLRGLELRYAGIDQGADVERILPPYSLTFRTEEKALLITVAKTAESLEASDADLRLAWPTNLSVATSARVVDASGTVLSRESGFRDDGVATIRHVVDLANEPGEPIEYPVTISLPDPEPVGRTPAVFIFEDLALPPIRARHVSASPWGKPSAGFAMRAGLPPRVEFGEPIRAMIELTREESGLPAGVTRFETRDADDFLTLRLTPEGGGEEIIIQPDDRTLGMPEPAEPGTPEPNLDRDPKPAETRFPLARAGEALPPGRYDCVVVLEIPVPEKRRWGYEEANERLWHGTLRSGRLPLEIVAEPGRTRTFRLPTRMRLTKGLGFNYMPEDTKEVKLPRRNGYHVGTRIRFAHTEEGSLLTSGVPEPGGPNAPIALPDPYRGEFRVTIKMTIFHTFDPPAHHWMPEGGLETLWERSFEVRFTAAMLEALR